CNRLREFNYAGRVYELRCPEGIKDVSDLHLRDEERFLEHFEAAVKASVRLTLAPGTKDRGYKFDAIDSPTFFAMDLRPQWLILNVLARRQPYVFAGPKKSLKTTLLIAMVIALASGQPFLGHFRTYGPVRVAILS